MQSAESGHVDRVVKINISRGLHDEVNIDTEHFEDCVVFDSENKPTRFGDIYQHRKTIAVFLRHPQCFTAKEYMEDLATIPDAYLEHANVQLITIGPHAPDLLPIFRAETRFRHAMYCDPMAAIYKAIGFRCNIEPHGLYPVNNKHVKSGWMSGVLSSTYRAAVWYRDFKADMRVNGGCLVLGPGRMLHSSHLDNSMFDQMPINSLLELVCGVTMSFPKDRRVLKV